MLYCPRCRRTYSYGDLVLWLYPRVCIRCGNQQLVRWDLARLVSWPHYEFIFGGRTCPSMWL